MIRRCHLVRFARAVTAMVALAAVAPPSSAENASDGSAYPPFVHGLHMQVVDPAVDEPRLRTIARFHQLVELPKAKRLLASFTLDDGAPGLLVLTLPELTVVEVRWLEESESGSAARWAAGIAADDGQAMFFAAVDTPDADHSRVHVITHAPGTEDPWRRQSIDLPEAPAAAAFLAEQRKVAFLTEPSNHFVGWAPGHDSLDVVEEIFDFVPWRYPVGTFLHPGHDGVLYGSYKGRLFGYHPGLAFFEYLGQLPCGFGQLSEVSLGAMAGDGETRLVGGVNGSGSLFVLDPETREVRPWGRPADASEIRSLVYVPDSGFWGLAAVPGQTTRLFQFQPADGLLEDHGVPAGRLEKDGRRWTWPAHRVAAMIGLADGRLVLAEASLQAKLLVFDPADLES